MKKILICLFILSVLPVRAEVVALTGKNDGLFLDGTGRYRYVRGEDIYQKGCNDIFSEAMKKKCLKAERTAWQKGKTVEEIQREGTLFTGKILLTSQNGEKNYFYVKDGQKGKEIELFFKYFYFEEEDGKNLLYDIRTEAPYSGDVVIGGVEGISQEKGKEPRFIVNQEYRNGFPVGEPKVFPISQNG